MYHLCPGCEVETFGERLCPDCRIARAKSVNSGDEEAPGEPEAAFAMSAPPTPAPRASFWALHRPAQRRGFAWHAGAAARN